MLDCFGRGVAGKQGSMRIRCYVIGSKQEAGEKNMHASGKAGRDARPGGFPGFGVGAERLHGSYQVIGVDSGSGRDDFACLFIGQ